MSPSIPDGSFVLVYNWAYRKKHPAPGEIVVFKTGGEFYCKRIKNQIGDNYDLAGDNSRDNYDSRDFGLVHKTAILGRVLLR